MQKKYTEESFKSIFKITKNITKYYNFFVILKKKVYAQYICKLINQITKQNHCFFKVSGYFTVFSSKMKKKKMLCIHQIGSAI
jgi:hypothetical protein